jgi:ATP-dependent helicase/DNAse subunit B
MPLHLIHGPPNTGRTGEVLREYTEQLRRDPLLVVPGVDDVFTWERRISREAGAFTGARVLTFNEMCLNILKSEGPARLPKASELRRQHLVRQAIVDSGWTEVIGRLPFQPGLVDAVLELIDDFRRELIDPDTLERTIRERGLRDLERVAGVYRSYLHLLVSSGWTDLPREIEAAVKAEHLRSEFENRPVFFAGFDDLSGQQLELISRLAVDAGTEVRVALTYEPENPAMKLTSTMMSKLRDVGQGTSLEETRTSRRESSGEHDPALREVERRFLRGTPGSEQPIPATEAVTVLRSSGPRNEAEAIASEIAVLLDRGTVPDRIAVAIENPADQGRLLREVMARYDIPSSLEAETAARDTATGQTVLAILEAVRPDGSADAALRWLRSPLYEDQDLVDRVELECRRLSEKTAEGVVRRLIKANGRPPGGWDELTEAVRNSGPVNTQIAKMARELGELSLFPDGSPDLAGVLESQTGNAIADACQEVEQFRPDGATGIDQIHEAIESGAVTVWSMPAVGTVRIASPYSLRAKRFENLFIASLQESGARDEERAGPFLSAEDRSRLGMTRRSDPEDQERYLFYSCLTVPTKRLWLSCRTSDETGKAEHESPLVAAVESLFEEVDGRPGVRHGGRSGSAIVFEAGTAPSRREVSRVLAAGGGGPDEVDLPADTAAEIVGELAEARVIRDDAARLSSLRVPAVLEILAKDPTFAVTEIEAYAGCPYRWFIEKQLSPVEFGPDSEPMTMGSLLHRVLEQVYRENDRQMPRPATLDSWLSRVPEIVGEAAAESRIRLDGDDPERAAMRRRATELVAAHLRREAAVENPLHVPAWFEHGFGTRDAAEPAIDLGSWRLKGKIDRVDVAPNAGPDGRPEAVVIDYKSGNVDDLTHHKCKKDRKFQLPLYLRAAEESLEVKPVAAIYVPVKAGRKPARGVFADSSREEIVKRGVSKQDGVDALDEFIREGVADAGDAVAGIIGGLLEHDPETCPDHFDHPAVPDRGWEEEEIFPGSGGGRP